MQINGNDIRKGDVLLIEGKLWACLSATHRTPGNLRAFMQVVLKNILDGQQKELRYSTSDRVEKVEVYEKDMQYLYNDGDNYIFMNPADYEQLEVNASVLGENHVYLIPEGMVRIAFFEGKALTVKFPQTLEFEVTEAEPGIKGATATASYKKAVLSNGVAVQVPQFIEAGEWIKINTESGEYSGRVGKK